MNPESGASPFVLSLSKDVVAPPLEQATWFDRLATIGIWARAER